MFRATVELFLMLDQHYLVAENLPQRLLFLFDRLLVNLANIQNKFLLSIENCFFKQHHEFPRSLNIVCITQFVGERLPHFSPSIVRSEIFHIMARQNNRLESRFTE